MCQLGMRKPLYGKLQRFFMKFPFIDIRARKNILPLLELWYNKTEITADREIEEIQTGIHGGKV